MFRVSSWADRGTSGGGTQLNNPDDLFARDSEAHAHDLRNPSHGYVVMVFVKPAAFDPQANRHRVKVLDRVGQADQMTFIVTKIL